MDNGKADSVKLEAINLNKIENDFDNKKIKVKHILIVCQLSIV